MGSIILVFSEESNKAFVMKGLTMEEDDKEISKIVTSFTADLLQVKHKKALSCNLHHLY